MCARGPGYTSWDCVANWWETVKIWLPDLEVGRLSVSKICAVKS